MKKLLPEPIAFAGSMVFLAIATVAFALLNPEVRFWLETMPPGLNAAVGAFSGTVIGLLGIAAAIVYHARAKREDRVASEIDEARVLAAAMHGEFIALSQWLATQSPSHTHGGPENVYRPNASNSGCDIAGFSTRPVFEANASRLDLLGPDLAAAVAYCHAIFEHAEWQHNADLSNGGANGAGNLPTVEAKLSATAGYLAAFAANGPGQINPESRQALFHIGNEQTED